MDVLTDEWMDGLTDGWMDELTDKWIDGWTDYTRWVRQLLSSMNLDWRRNSRAKGEGRVARKCTA